MHSRLATALESFGTICLCFGAVIVVIGFLGIRFGTRSGLGGAGAIALGFLIAGTILAGSGYMIGRSGRKNEGSRV